MTLEEFMEFFNSDDYLEETNLIIREHIFLNALQGSDDLKKDLLERLCENYGTTLEEVIQDGSSD